MNLAIVGYGKMGQLIEQLAPEYGFDVKLRLDMDNNAKFEGITPENFRGMDVAIEFSTPPAARRKYRAAGALGVNTVVGTTGWFGEMERARAAVERGGIGLVWSPNFSIGVNVFARWSRRRRGCSRASRNTARGPGKFITPRRRTRPRARCCSWSRK